MPSYVAIGATKQEVMESCPLELEYWIEAAKKRRIDRDIDNWMLGLYIESAVSTAIEHNFAGKKAKSKYLDKPLLSEEEKNTGSAENGNIQKQRELFMSKLLLMKSNYEIEKKRKEVEENADSGRTCDTD